MGNKDEKGQGHGGLRIADCGLRIADEKIVGQ
jgi:hypothetical protein